ncbi:MAG: putative Ig domain-containing protein [Acidobacteriota bacterium]
MLAAIFLGSHTLAQPTGPAWAWGDNGYGPLSVGRFGFESLPMQGTGLHNVVGVEAGGWHSLALLQDGTVWAWGDNSQGILGIGTTAPRSSPAQVLGLSDVTAVAAGGQHSLALQSDGTVWSWGNNSWGQLGIGTHDPSWVPTRVQGLTSVIAIAAGGNHALALRADGTVWSWGGNADGQLGLGHTNERTLPTRIVSLSNASAVSAGGAFSLVLSNDGTVWSFGNNVFGQLGDGTTTDRTLPVPVMGLPGASSVRAGGFHSLALSGAGTLYAWGMNSNGQLGLNDWANRLEPTPVTDLAGLAVTRCSGGTYHSLAVTEDGSLWAWGSGHFGELGNGSSATLCFPVEVSGLSNPVTLSASNHCLAATSDGSLWTWGNNFMGQLGLGWAGRECLPVRTQGTGRVRAGSGGSDHTLFLDEDGSVWASGLNDQGQLGDGTYLGTDTAVKVLGIEDAAFVSAGGLFSTALREDGTVWTWGSNGTGELGQGSLDFSSPLPGQVLGISTACGTAAGWAHGLALLTDGTVRAWGANWHGQLGVGNTLNQWAPVQVPGLTGIVAIASGGNHCLALRADGTVMAWGENNHGQVGDGTLTSRLFPVQVFGLSNIVAVAAGAVHSLALRGDGTVFSWGLTLSGAPGDASWTDSTLPLQVSGLPAVSAIAAGGSHSLALAVAGSIWAWGDNSRGQLGDGSLDSAPLPQEVQGVPDPATIGAGHAFSLAVQACPALAILPSTLADATVGSSYALSLSASGGTGPYAFHVTSGALPAGMSISETGLLDGSPSATGTFTFTVTAVDSNGCTGRLALTLRVVCPTIAIVPESGSLPAGTVGQLYQQALSGTAGTGPYVFALTAGQIPPGLSLGSDGWIAGTPTQPGESAFAASATDANGCVGEASYSLSVACPVISLVPASVPQGTVGVPYSQAIGAVGGTAPYTFSESSGSPPPGLSLAPGGVLSGTPIAAGTYPFTVRATDAYGCGEDQTYDVSFLCPSIDITPLSLPVLQVGRSFSQVFTASGGSAPYTFDVIQGSVPPGLILSPEGLLQGTPTQAGAFGFHIRANDVYTCSLAIPVDVTVVVPPALDRVKKITTPFRLRLTGSNLQPGLQVFVGGQPWTQVDYKDTSRILLVGGGGLKALFPSGVPVTVRVLNPDAGEAFITWTR